MSETVFCRDCGNEINVKAEICPKCGIRQKEVPTVNFEAVNIPVKDVHQKKIIAVVLAFFLGGLGFHKFYLGSIAWGLVYLFFCWTFIPAIIGLLEAIVYLSTSDEDFARKYIKNN